MTTTTIFPDAPHQACTFCGAQLNGRPICPACGCGSVEGEAKVIRLTPKVIRGLHQSIHDESTRPVPKLYQRSIMIGPDFEALLGGGKNE